MKHANTVKCIFAIALDEFALVNGKVDDFVGRVVSKALKGC